MSSQDLRDWLKSRMEQIDRRLDDLRERLANGKSSERRVKR